MNLSLRFLRPLRSDERGTSLIEFGFMAPLLSLMVAGAVDLSTMISERFTLQQAVHRSLEMLQSRHAVADADDADVDYEYLRTETATAAGVDIEAVTLTRWLECDGVRRDDYFGSCAAGQETTRYLQLAVSKDYQGRFFLGTTPMTASVAVRIQ